MSTAAQVLVVMLAGCGGALLAFAYFRLASVISARRRRTRFLEPCEVCGVELARPWVVAEHCADDRQLGIDGGGGTFLAATYCRRHAPSIAVRAPR